MSDEIKDNEHIRADQHAFMEAFGRAKAVLGAIDGVVSVGFGSKQTGGEFTDDVAIQVFVREKKPEDQIPPAQRIPPTFEGYRTDVRVVPRGILASQVRYTTIQGGISIEPKGSGSVAGTHNIGTLGCIVRRQGDSSRGNVYLLTCDHVLAANGARPDDYVYHPQVKGSDQSEATALGPIQPGGRQQKVNGLPAEPDDFYIDCAIARIDIDKICCGSTCDTDVILYDTAIADLDRPTDPASLPRAAGSTDDRIKGVRSVAHDLSIVLPTATSAWLPLGDPRAVFKVGARTGKTRGVVRSVLLPLDPGPHAPFRHNVIEIEFAPTVTTPTNPLGHIAFGEHGDSGAIVVDANHKAIGMVFSIDAGASDPGQIRWSTYACHIMPVLQELGICIPTTDSSTGSCAAIDGTGLAPRPRRAELPAPDGQIHFTGGSGDGARRQERLTSLRERLHESPHGRELWVDFSEVQREIAHLVRDRRPVMVAWQRHRGPAFLAHLLNHLRGDTPRIPREVEGVSRDVLLARMLELLVVHGSNPLREAAARHGALLRATLADADTADDWLEALQRCDLTEEPESART